MARKNHWMMDIVKQVRDRMDEVSAAAAEHIHDSVPFGDPPPKPKGPDIQAFLQASPDQRQQFWASIPPEQYGNVVSDLQSQAVAKWGAMASVITPMIQGDEMAAVQANAEFGLATGADAHFGVAQAQQDLTDLLGIDPFGR